MSRPYTPVPWVLRIRPHFSSGSAHYSIENESFNAPCPCGSWHPPGRLVAWMAGGLGDADLVARRPACVRPDAEARADAEFILAAVNSHQGLLSALADAERFMSALVEMWKADMREDHEHGMVRFNSGGFVEAIRNARAALAQADPGQPGLPSDHEDKLALAESRSEELERRAGLTVGTLPCGGCGGPHRFDTSVPSVTWNAVIRAKGLSEYLCTSCIVREFVKAGQSFTAQLWGEDFSGTPIEIRVGGIPSEDAARLSDENATLRHVLRDLHERAGAAIDEVTRGQMAAALAKASPAPTVDAQATRESAGEGDRG